MVHIRGRMSKWEMVEIQSTVLGLLVDWVHWTVVVFFFSFFFTTAHELPEGIRNWERQLQLKQPGCVSQSLPCPVPLNKQEIEVKHKCISHAKQRSPLLGSLPRKWLLLLVMSIVRRFCALWERLYCLR